MSSDLRAIIRPRVTSFSPEEEKEIVNTEKVAHVCRVRNNRNERVEKCVLSAQKRIHLIFPMHLCMCVSQCE